MFVDDERGDAFLVVGNKDNITIAHYPLVYPLNSRDTMKDSRLFQIQGLDRVFLEP